jgi:aspartate/tyrosine/aromatic aminotransferase
MEAFQRAKERFESDTAKHEMIVMHDDGLYRHLREQHGVYVIRSGRLCVAGLNTHNVEPTALAMALVL